MYLYYNQIIRKKYINIDTNGLDPEEIFILRRQFSPIPCYCVSCFSELCWSVHQARLWLVQTEAPGHWLVPDWLEVQSAGKWCNEWSCPFSGHWHKPVNTKLLFENFQYQILALLLPVHSSHSTRLLGVWLQVENNNFIITGDCGDCGSWFNEKYCFGGPIRQHSVFYQ